MFTQRSFIAALSNVKDVNQHYAFIDLHASRGDIATLKDLFITLSRQATARDVPDWAIVAVMEHIIEALALTDGIEDAATALELAAISDSRGVETEAVQSRLPAVVSRVVAAQSPEVIDILLRRAGDLEVAGLVLHEAVIRGKLPIESVAGQNTHDRLTTANHPLASLPIARLVLEGDVQLPVYSIGASGTSNPFGPMRDGLAVAPAPPTDSLDITETTCAERANRISSAVAGWKNHSNGKIEARTFYATLPDNYTIGAILPKLGLESLQPIDVVHLHANPTAKNVFTVLFSAASNGGAYNRGNYAAYGRLLAWQSLAGLVGSASEASVWEIASIAEKCRWCIFDSPNDWYYQVAWDIGIACVNAVRGELVVLAATDTD
jgi:hypothetical protein